MCVGNCGALHLIFFSLLLGGISLVFFVALQGNPSCFQLFPFISREF